MVTYEEFKEQMRERAESEIGIFFVWILVINSVNM